MKKYVILVLLVAFAGFIVNCGNRPIQQGAFRVKTRGKIHLFGFPLPFSVPNPNIAINLKLTATPAPGTFNGNVSEFNPGGSFVSTDGGGIFDASNAVIPAVWNARIAPNQSRCSAPVSNPFSFSASNQSTHKLNCKWNVQISFLTSPQAVAVGLGMHPATYVPAATTIPANSLTAVDNQPGGPFAAFKGFSAAQLKALYYRQVDGEDYVLDGEKPVTSISADGTSIVIPVPNYTSNSGLKHYRILIQEDGVNEIYVAHGEVDVSYGIRRECNGTGRTCQEP